MVCLLRVKIQFPNGVRSIGRAYKNPLSVRPRRRPTSLFDQTFKSRPYPPCPGGLGLFRCVFLHFLFGRARVFNPVAPAVPLDYCLCLFPSKFYRKKHFSSPLAAMRPNLNFISDFFVRVRNS